MKYVTLILATLLLVALSYIGFTRMSRNDNQANTVSPSNSAPSSDNVIDKSSTGLTRVDQSIYSQTSTTTLILSNNNLKSLPSELGKMSNVEILKIDHNLLEGSLIAEIRQMSRLRVLDASNNLYSGVPAEIGQLNRLEELNLSNNKITALPNEISNIQNNLKTLDLRGNPISPFELNSIKSKLPNTQVLF